MAKNKTAGSSVNNSNFASKRSEPEDTPVAACKGWVDSCEFCDKRFCDWTEAVEDTLDKIPQKPGMFMIAAKVKGTTEVVDIALDASDIQKLALQRTNRFRDCVADKKSKFTKAAILCRWMNFKQPGEKDVVNLCAHWCNLGVLPKMLEAWPGQEILGKTDLLVYSDRLQKWCYPKKDPVWRKTKTVPSKVVEVIDPCDWEKPCEICDSFFSEWRDLDDAVDDDMTPEGNGIFMVAVKHGKNREVVNIYYDQKVIKLAIKSTLRNSRPHLPYVLKNKKFANKDASLQVRWMEMNSVETDNCCFLYAHWLNADRIPMMSSRLPGEKVLERNKNFVTRINDKKWCHELEMFKQLKNAKSKSKRRVIADLEEEVDMNCES